MIWCFGDLVLWCFSVLVLGVLVLLVFLWFGGSAICLFCGSVFWFVWCLGVLVVCCCGGWLWLFCGGVGGLLFLVLFLLPFVCVCVCVCFGGLFGLVICWFGWCGWFGDLVTWCFGVLVV